MRNIRLIARLDIKAPNLIKSIQLEGLRKLGNPNTFAKDYYYQGVDEIFCTDVVASLLERNSLLDIISYATKDIYVPITVGGGIRSTEDVLAVLRAGADKVAINTAAIKNSSIISDVAARFGSQCMVLSIQAKWSDNHWEAYYDNGRERSGIDVIDWAVQGQKLGAGEIILTSVDKEGTAKGFDAELVSAVTNAVTIPVVASGGMGCLSDIGNIVNNGGADAVAMAHVLHYGHLTINEIRDYCVNQNIPVRLIS